MLVQFFCVAVECRQWAVWMRRQDAAGSFGVGALVLWDRRILLVLFTASTCDYLRGLGWAAWFGGVGWRHGVAMKVLLHGWIIRTPLDR